MFRFRCSGCGLCCQGWLPLTVSESFGFAAAAPLAIVWKLFHPSSPQYATAMKMFGRLDLGNGLHAAPWIRPMMLILPSDRCPHLKTDGLCSIHETKPVRCRTMPFQINVPAEEQERHLKPGKDWPCFNAADGDVVYDQGRFVSAAYRAAVQTEARALRSDAPLLKRHCDQTVRQGGTPLLSILRQVMATPGGHLILPWARLLALTKHDGTAAAAQFQVLAQRLGEQTLPATYRAHYSSFAAELAAFSVSP